MVNAVFMMLVCLLGILKGSSILSAVQPLTYAALETGYRWDNTNNRVQLWQEGAATFASTLTIHGTNSWQLGGRAQWAVFQGNGFIRIDGHYSWIWDGEYDEGNFFSPITGNIVDVNPSLGYCLAMHPCWGIVPIIGYSYNKFTIEATDVVAQLPALPLQFLGKSNLNQKFQGPFVGVQWLCQPGCRWNIELEWNLHHGWWNANRLPAVGDYGNPPFGTTTGFANKRTFPVVWGNCFLLNIRYFVLAHWAVGVHLKYQHWVGQGQGKYIRTITPSPLPHQKILNLEWHSFGALVNLGYYF